MADSTPDPGDYPPETTGNPRSATEPPACITASPAVIAAAQRAHAHEFIVEHEPRRAAERLMSGGHRRVPRPRPHWCLRHRRQAVRRGRA